MPDTSKANTNGILAEAVSSTQHTSPTDQSPRCAWVSEPSPALPRSQPLALIILQEKHLLAIALRQQVQEILYQDYFTCLKTGN